MVYAITRTKLKQPEIPETKAESLVSFEIPTREEIVKKISEHFASHPNDSVTEEDISKIADKVSESFEELKDKPYEGFAKYSPTKPALHIFVYGDEFTLSDRERYPGDYSTLEIFLIRCSAINFHVTVVRGTKQIRLAYVSR